MADQWYYTENRERRGPLPEEQLKQLASSGKIKPTDLVWKKGMANWVAASSVDWLFPPAKSDADVPPPLSSEAPPQPNQISFGDRFKAATTKAGNIAASLARKGKAAAQLIAKQAERTKISTITLPNAYQSLGKHVHQAGAYRDDLGDIYQKIDGLLKDIEAHSAPSTKAEGFTEKAKAVAKASKDMAQVQSLKMKVNRAFAELGKASFEKHGEASGPAEVVQPVIAGRVRLEKLDVEIGELSQSQPGTFFTPKRIAIGGVGVALVAVLLLLRGLFVGSHSDQQQLANREVVEGAPATSDRAKEGRNSPIAELGSRDVSHKAVIALKVVEEVSLGKRCPGILLNSVRVSPDNKRMAYGVRNGKTWSVVVDGQDGKKQDKIGQIVFSPDSQRLAYTAKRSNKWFVVVDGQEMQEHDGLGLGSVLFSPDSKRLAYAAHSGRKWLVAVGGQMEKEYDVIAKGSIVFSPDSRRFAYVARRGNKSLAVVDGHEGNDYDNVHGIAFSPDGKRVAYSAIRGNNCFLVLDGIEGKAYPLLGKEPPCFSPDSKRVAFAAGRNHTLFAVVDGVEGKSHGGADVLRLLAFSPDSKRLAYVVDRGKNRFVVLDGVDGEEYPAIARSGVIFSPDSSRMAYGARSDRGSFLVVNGKAGRQYDSRTMAIFSPDSSRIAYAATLDTSRFVVVDEAEGADYDGCISAIPTWTSPTTLRVVMRRGDEYLRVEIEIVEGDPALIAHKERRQHPRHDTGKPSQMGEDDNDDDDDDGGDNPSESKSDDAIHRSAAYKVGYQRGITLANEQVKGLNLYGRNTSGGRDFLANMLQEFRKLKEMRDLLIKYNRTNDSPQQGTIGMYDGFKRIYEANGIIAETE